MITNDTLAAMFGGSIPPWFWVIAGIAVIIALIVFGGSSTGGGSNKSSRDQVRAQRNIDGSYYAYNLETGQTLYQADTREEVESWIDRNTA